MPITYECRNGCLAKKYKVRKIGWFSAVSIDGNDYEKVLIAINNLIEYFQGKYGEYDILVMEVF